MMPPPPGMGGPAPMMQPTAPPPSAADLSTLVGMMGMLSKEKKESPTDKVKRAIDILDEVREMDPKQGSIASAAIHMLRNGKDGVEMFFDGPPRMRKDKD